VEETATPDSWEIAPMPSLREQIEFHRRFSREEYARIARGHVPESMDDKWFVYVEDDLVHIHRSWTGFCSFEIELAPSGDGYEVAAAWVNRDPEQRMDPAFDHVAGSILDHLAAGEPA
jgi:hypothetical protein